VIARLKPLSLVESALLLAALTSAGLLAGAHAFETFGGLAPCKLCLDQREAHWAGLGVALAGVILAFALKARRAAAAAAGACALIYVVSSGLAAYHAGVERHYWPGPKTCSGGGPVNVEGLDLGAELGAPASGPSCDAVAWEFLGVTMAGYNLLISAGLAALCLVAAANAARNARHSVRAGAALGGELTK